MESSSSSSSTIPFPRFDIVSSADSISPNLTTPSEKRAPHRPHESLHHRHQGDSLRRLPVLHRYRVPVELSDSPPKVIYRSAGFSIHRNIYLTGHLCLNLLGPWGWSKEESWNPSQSNILQVLLSIQALVLTQRPMFNEGLMGSWAGHRYYEEEPLAYNEEVFLSCCRTTLSLLRDPPKDFETLVSSHFHEHGNTILETCVKQYNKPSIPRTRSFSPSSTEKFKNSLMFVYPELHSAFAGIGAPLEDLPLWLEPTLGKKTTKGGFEKVKEGKI